MSAPRYRSICALAALFCVCLWARSAHAQDDDLGDVELGARIGALTGGGASPGGVLFGGTMLYRLSDIDWFEGGLSLILGSGTADCFTDRQGAFVCKHGPVAGRVGELSAGVRRYLIPGEFFSPYAGARLGVRLVSFPGDEVRGVSVPLHLGAGVRARVAPTLTVHGGADFEVGVGLFDHDLGMVPQFGLNVHLGVEFALF